ncbi:LysM peptidoglycan-binding domain-containing protein [Ferrimonas pelagia]|uniref:LysM domain-containing protein n=1 Tax=Ferrimonas pelagia TaxID=1177826 RepID=A0ABP9ETA1_9GAMM
MIYTVKPGDTLSAIATTYLGSGRAVETIVRDNQLTDPGSIQVGQKLVLNLPQSAAVATLTVPSRGLAHAVSMAGALTLPQLAQIFPQTPQERLAPYCDALNQVLPRYAITTRLRQAHFLAQIGHESGGFCYTSENLNYSASALRGVFGKYFSTDGEAQRCARQPEQIANRVYADRMGNGDRDSGDGWRYRGRGLIQLTGCDNYRDFGRYEGIDLLASPQRVADEPELAVASACWFWNRHHLSGLADQDDLKAITHKINGGYQGLVQRADLLARAKRALALTNC